MRIPILLVVLAVAAVASNRAEICCMSTHVQDQAVIAADNGFTDIVIDPNGTCDTAGISWTFSVMRTHYTYRLIGEDLYTTAQSTVSGMPLAAILDTNLGWCGIAVERGATALLPQGLTISPNPARSAVSVQFPNSGAKASFEIFNAAGIRVYQQRNITGSSVTFGAERLGKGAFFVRVKADGRIFVGHLIRQ